MTTHYVSETNAVHVTGAERYRVSFSVVLTPGHPLFNELQQDIKEEHRRPEGYGLGFLESEEHSVLYVGPIEQIQQYQAGTTALDVSQGAVYDRWPHGNGWDEYIPDNTWNSGGEGIITTFDHPHGGDVVVYEFHGSWTPDRPKQPLVTFHCTHCHADTFHDSGKVQENTGPSRRRWAARQARLHIRSAERHGAGHEHSECRKTNPQLMKLVAQAASQMSGRDVPEITWESRCAAAGPCAQIRDLRARALNHSGT